MPRVPMLAFLHVLRRRLADGPAHVTRPLIPPKAASVHALVPRTFGVAGERDGGHDQQRAGFMPVHVRQLEPLHVGPSIVPSARALGLGQRLDHGLRVVMVAFHRSSPSFVCTVLRFQTHRGGKSFYTYPSMLDRGNCPVCASRSTCPVWLRRNRGLIAYRFGVLPSRVIVPLRLHCRMPDATASAR